MSEENTLPSELDELKDRATTLGIKYHPSIGIESLRAKVNAALSPEATEDAEVTNATGSLQNKPSIAELKKKSSEQVRIMVTCMNPNKKDWQGEMFCVGNAKIGTFKKFVPFETEWHVPRIILDMIKARKCQVFYTERDKRTGLKTRKGKLIKEYAVDELPPLSERELKDLAQRQAMANGTSQ